MHWIKDINGFFAMTSAWKALTARLETSIYEEMQEPIDGYCEICNQVVGFSFSKTNNSWIDLRGEFVCQKCMFSARIRFLLSAIVNQIGELHESNILLFEQITPLYRHMKSLYPNVVGCEYLGESYLSGQCINFNGQHILHQDMLSSSYPDSHFDYVFHSDVLEHVPDYLKALKENYRILKKEGVLIFAAPIYNHYEHIICAKIDNYGGISHLEEPAYHGNPLSDKGSLVFTRFGYKIVQELRDIGFSDVVIGFNYSLFDGYVSNGNPYYEIGHMWPVLIKASRMA